MAVEVKPDDYKALLSESLRTIRKLRQEGAQGARTREPVAVVGMGCRFPGGSVTPEAYWEFLSGGGDGVVEVPADRWDVEELYDPEPGKPGKIYLKEGGFLQEDIRGFDAHFFGISPLEAAETDPQQRLLLEVAWEALERAGIPADSLRGTRTGVFIGVIGSEYAGLPRAEQYGNPYTLTGAMSAIMSGRVSYVLGAQGPSLSVDTACSSSLVSVHLACESLLRGESDTALAGGVNLLLSPTGFASLCDLGALSKDGRCKSFDASGDGYGRGEGCGVVVLKRLSDARRDGDPVLAVIKASGVNQDGPGSGLTVPNGSAQRDLIRRTLAEAGVVPAEVGYFEAHGTGTALGDPIEFQAIKDVFANDPSRERELRIGSVKSNIGHLEAAAGVAGLIKLVLCLQHGKVPPNLHLNTVNPKIRLADIPASVPRTCEEWEAGAGARTAAISSYGFSGTNAHAIVAEAPEPAGPRGGHGERPLHLLALSARSKGALRALTDSYLRFLDGGGLPALGDLCHTANAGRSHFAHRLAVVAGDHAELRQRLREYTPPEAAPRPASGPRTAFVFAGRYDDRLARELYATQPAFRAAADACDEAVRSRGGTGITDGLAGTRNRTPPAAADAVAAFCLEYALDRMWASWGVRPHAVIGRGSGVYAAACAAGVMDPGTALAFLLPSSARPSGGIRLRPAGARVFSGSTGGVVDRRELLDPTWWEGAGTVPAEPFGPVVQRLAADYDHCVTMAPPAPADRPAGAYGNGTATETEAWPQLARTLAALYEAGTPVDWAGFDSGHDRRKVLLPTYPYQRKPFWTQEAPPGAAPARPAAPRGSLEGQLIHAPLGADQVGFDVPMAAVPDVRATHGVMHVGHYLELVARALRLTAEGEPPAIRSLRFTSPLVLREDRDNRLVVALQEGPDGTPGFTVHAQGEHRRDWTRHAEGSFVPAGDRPASEAPAAPPESGPLTHGFDGPTAGDAFYGQAAAERRLALGEDVRWLSEVWTREGAALARLVAPAGLDTAGPWLVGSHPGALDACAQLFHAALPRSVPPDMKFMVTEWREIRLPTDEHQGDLWCRVTVEEFDEETAELRGALALLDGRGRISASVGGVTMKGIGAEHDQLFRELAADGGADGSQDSEPSPILLELGRTSAERRAARLEEYLRERFAELLRMDDEDLDPHERLSDLGMDSLVGVRAKALIEQELRVRLPMETLIEGPSVRDLAAAVLPGLDLAEVPAAAGPAPAGPRAATAAAGWIAHRTPNPRARLKLFCLPYGSGGGASVYRGWQELLPDDIEVCPVQLPGKESRIREKAFEDAEAAADALCEALLPELDRPYAFYGHSMGALLAYRVAHRLWRRHGIKPGHLFVGAYSAPSVRPNPLVAFTREKFAAIGYDEIPGPADLATATPAEREAVLGVLTSEADVSEELARALLPTRLAELKLVRDYQEPDEATFDVPVTAVHGLRDDKVTESDMAAWQKATSGAFALHLVSGDHLFLREDQDQRLLLLHIARALAP
ncbi:polyketide synthase dehydratase domain-containing protein [Streptomyces sp. NBC_01166]|uniref:beta-ketoacyl synthase N-terminal-like domain-containing protein n=1 Tax=Streptomyces sp. NBC_01166 TaxID=2903755 RepID=UPI00386C0F5E|nr:polyketide synthase dehydratase domain-containing protein [Streptomyces sp. NBC_01166]